jgi:MFS family permease
LAKLLDTNMSAVSTNDVESDPPQAANDDTTSVPPSSPSNIQVVVRDNSPSTSSLESSVSSPSPVLEASKSSDETTRSPEPVKPIARRDTTHFMTTLQTKGLSHEHSMAAIVQEKKDVGTRKIVYTLICIMQLFANFDAGVIPSGLNQIMTEYSLTSTEAGWLGSLVYIGLVFSCPITGYLLTKMKSQRKILIGSLFLNIVALILFVTCPSDAKSLLMFTRFLTGLSQAPLFVFPPVWVDEFAPKDSLTLYCALLQAMVPLGITFGFVGCLTFQKILGEQVGWRAAIWLQIGVLLPFVLVFSLLRGRYFNVLGGKEARLHDQAKKMERAQIDGTRVEREEARQAALESGVRESKLGSELEFDEEDEEDEGPSMSDQLCTILRRPVYLWIVLGLSGLYFVVTGIQFWTVSYMINVLGAALLDVQIAFAISSITGPLLGVFFGGWLVDKMGGYKEDSMATANTLLTCNIFGVGAVMCAIPAAFVDSFVGCVTLIWLILFFGGALLPALTGVCLTSVPEDCRAVASSFSMFTYNILGYALAPVLMGAIADSFVSRTDPTCIQNCALGQITNLTDYYVVDLVVNTQSGAAGYVNHPCPTVPCVSEMVGATRGFQVGMFTSIVAVTACVMATMSQLRLATNGARPAFLACIPYTEPAQKERLSDTTNDDLDTTVMR